MKCTAFGACGKPATYVLSDGSGRCGKHRKGRGRPITLAEGLAELEASNPFVRHAAEKLDAVVDEIIKKTNPEDK